MTFCIGVISKILQIQVYYRGMSSLQNSYVGMSYHKIINVTYTPIEYINPLYVEYSWNSPTKTYVDAKSEVRKVVSGYAQSRYDSAGVRDWVHDNPQEYYKQMKILNHMERSGLKGIAVSNRKEVNKLRIHVLQECYTINTGDVSSLKLIEVPLHTLYTQASTDTYKSGDLVCLRRLRIGNSGYRDYTIFPNLREIIYYFTYNLRLKTVPSTVSHMTIMRSSGLNDPEDEELKDLVNLNTHYLRVDCSEYTGEWIQYVPKSVYMLVINFRLIKRGTTRFDPTNFKYLAGSNVQVVVIGMSMGAERESRNMETEIIKYNPQIKVYITEFSSEGEPGRGTGLSKPLYRIITNAWFS